MSVAKAEYAPQKWNRRPWNGEASAEPANVKLGRVEMVHVYKGDIEGEGILQYLFVYNQDGEGSFVGLEKVTGSIGGKSGSFVFQCTGSAQNGRMRQSLTVIPGSGTGELKELKGQATMECNLHLDQYPVILDYEL